MDTLEIARSIIDTLEEKKGEDILLLDIREMNTFTDFFIICSGSSDRMIESLAKAVEETTKKKFNIYARAEGIASEGWRVVDLEDIVVHLFSPDQRDYYQLERLWVDGKVLLHLH